LETQFSASVPAYVDAAQAAHVPAAVFDSPVKRVSEKATCFPQVVWAATAPSAAIQFPSIGSQQIRVSTAAHVAPAQTLVVSALACFQ